MDSFIWTRNFETGVPAVDRQHSKLVDIINLFGHRIASNEFRLKDIFEIFEQLTNYAQYHFQEEEALMVRIGLDRRFINSHSELHKDFLHEITAITTGITIENAGDAQNLLDFLTHWLTYHILGTDQNMARQIRAIRDGQDSTEAYEAIRHRKVDGATGPLLAALKGLFQQISSRNKELVQLNQLLEDKVAERTRELSEANRHLEELSITDHLTGLPNRRHAMRCLADLWKESVLSGKPLTCMMIDADHFKEVNDTYGHDVGDQVLRELARTLRDAIRNDDIVCRMGGDEFLIICPYTDERDSLHVAEQVCATVSKLRVPTGDRFWRGSVSIGVAARSTETGNYEQLIKIADQSVYLAKEDGKGCVRKLSTNNIALKDYRPVRSL